MMASLNTSVREDLWLSANQMDLTSSEDFSRLLPLSGDSIVPLSHAEIFSVDSPLTPANCRIMEAPLNTETLPLSRNVQVSQQSYVKKVKKENEENNHVDHNHSVTMSHVVVDDHLHYTLSDAGLRCSSSNNLSPLEKNIIEVAHDSPDSDSGFSEEAIPPQNMNKIVTSVPSSSKLASLLKQPHIGHVVDGHKFGTTVVNTVSDAIPQNCHSSSTESRSNMSLLSLQSNVQSQNVKYLIPVQLNSLKGSNGSTPVNIVQIPQGMNLMETQNNVTTCNVSSLNSMSSVPSLCPVLTTSVSLPSPIYVIPMAEQKDCIKLDHSALEISKSRKHNGKLGHDEPRLIKVLQSTVTNSSALNGAILPTSTECKKPKSSSEALKKHIFKMSSQMTAKDKKLKNAARNIFMCPLCKKHFAINRILLQSGGMYVQGKPRYCITCCEKVKKS